ncbi:hypothetical protein Krac_3995 [Ktedonobacter racemifer DSM 44963]|uniref:Uncharacterized protein n=1 Tax=Ktedonobacter racemifer DSM 44963 TaxID=485913 RepID=D6TXN1_KTERA|nr:hypothetical protein Krac_3995 [Ktedonobacter racemifer DSM 44963]
MYGNRIRKSWMYGETVFVEPKFCVAFRSAHRSMSDAMSSEDAPPLRGCVTRSLMNGTQ